MEIETLGVQQSVKFYLQGVLWPRLL